MELIHKPIEVASCGVCGELQDVWCETCQSRIVASEEGVIVDRVVYVAGGKVRVGTPDEVLRSDVLSELYGSHVDVFHRGDRIIVLADEERSSHLHAPEISGESEEIG